MTMEELYTSFRNEYEKEEADSNDLKVKYDAQKKKIDRLRARIEEAERKARRLSDRISKASRITWMDSIVKPLVAAIEKETNSVANVYGPLGIGHHVTICFCQEDGTNKILVLEPFFEKDEFHLEYWTGKILDRYAPGTLGYVNDLNFEMAPLPNDLGSIIQLLRETNNR